MLQTFKIVHGKDDVNPADWFKMAAANERTTRATVDPLSMRIPAPRLEVRRNFFSQRVPKLWNGVPAAIKQAATTAGASTRKFGEHGTPMTAAVKA